MADIPDFRAAIFLIAQNHPDIMPLLNKPGVLSVVLRMEQAEQNQQPWTTAQLDAALQSTEYWQTTDAQQRAFDQKQATDPASAHTQIVATAQMVRDLEDQLGFHLSNAGGIAGDEFQFAFKAAQMGWTPDQIKYNLIAQGSKTIGGGDIGNYAAQVHKTMDDYGVPLGDFAVMGWANKLAQGAVDQNAITGYAIQQAKSLFPGLNDALDRGITVRQYADPYLQIANQELGTNPNTVSLTDPKWMKAINAIDPKTGARGSMSLSDWTALIRSDSSYGYDQTDKAKTQAAAFAGQLGQMMGAIG